MRKSYINMAAALSLLTVGGFVLADTASAAPGDTAAAEATIVAADPGLDPNESGVTETADLPEAPEPAEQAEELPDPEDTGAADPTEVSDEPVDAIALPVDTTVADPAEETEVPDQNNGDLPEPPEADDVADPTEPSDDVADPTEPSDDVADPTEPSDDVADPTEPSDDVADPTEPSDDVADVEDPATPNEGGVIETADQPEVGGEPAEGADVDDTADPSDPAILATDDEDDEDDSIVGSSEATPVSLSAGATPTGGAATGAGGTAPVDGTDTAPFVIAAGLGLAVVAGSAATRRRFALATRKPTEQD